MSKYFFAVLSEYSTLTGGAKAAQKRDSIAREIGGRGCGYEYFRDPGKSRMHGFGYAPNRGEPFDRQTAAEIMAAWEKGGV